MRRLTPTPIAVLVVAGFLVAATAPAKTTLSIRTQPAGAAYRLQKVALQGVTDAKVEIPKSAFQGGSTIEETVTFTKEGYWPAELGVSIRKGKQNDVQTTLQEIDTRLTIDSTPSGALVELSVPLLGISQFTTPHTFEMPAGVAVSLAGVVNITRVFMEGHLAESGWVGRGLSIPPGQNTRLDIPLEPILTSLEVLTEPEGADVEDIEPSGFGYLGTTPLRRSFTFDDLKRWADKQRVVKFQGNEPELQNPGGFEAIELTLRISMAGYEDTFLRSIKIPVGEERSFHRSMAPQANQVRFMSDPSGAHVFVLRFTEKDIYDESSGQLRRERVTEEKYLGTTPFTYNVDPADPLIHGERLMFRKSGYKDQIIRYSAGESTYFVVM